MALVGVQITAAPDTYGYLTVQVKGKSAKFQATGTPASGSLKVALSLADDMSDSTVSAAFAGDPLRVTVRGLTEGATYYYRAQIDSTPIADCAIQSFKCGALDNETIRIACPSDMHPNGYQGETPFLTNWYYDRLTGATRDTSAATLAACVHPITGRGEAVGFDAGAVYHNYAANDCVGFGIKSALPHFIQCMGDDVFTKETMSEAQIIASIKNFHTAMQYFGQSAHFITGGHENDYGLRNNIQAEVYAALQTYRLDPENGVVGRYGYYDLGAIRVINLAVYPYTTYAADYPARGWAQELGSVQAAWFAEALKGRQKLNVVCMHTMLTSNLMEDGVLYNTFGGATVDGVDYTALGNNWTEVYEPIQASGKECVVVMGHVHNYSREITDNGIYVYTCPAPYNQRPDNDPLRDNGQAEEAPHYGGTADPVRGTLIFEIDQVMWTLKSWVVQNDGTVSSAIPVSNIKLKVGGSMG